MAQARDFRVEAAWRTLLKDLGVRERDALRRAQLPEDLLSRADARLGTDDYFRFWLAVEAEVDDPEFPIRLADLISAEAFSPPLFAALCSRSLGVALPRLGRYKRLVAPMRLETEARPDGLVATFRYLHATTPAPASLVVFECMFLVRLARMATREPVRPRTVTMPEWPKPKRALERWLGARITRGDVFSVVFSKEDAERPFMTANDAMWKMFEPALQKRLAELDAEATVSDRVTAVMLGSLPSGEVSMDAVAARLAMSKRTLQRHLKRENSSYQGLLAQTREQLAKHYLAKTDLSCAEIAFLLGYEEPNSFFRAFHEWTGDSPLHMRQVLTTH